MTVSLQKGDHKYRCQIFGAGAGEPGKALTKLT
jgi:hypothetical protein